MAVAVVELYHESLPVSRQSGLQQVRQLRVSEGDVSVLVSDGHKNIRESAQTLVNCHGLLHSRSGSSGTVQSLGSCQIDQAEGASQADILLHVGGLQVQSKHGVRARGALIHVCLCGASLSTGKFHDFILHEPGRQAILFLNYYKETIIECIRLPSQLRC
jgi:hypothetical protein